MSASDNLREYYFSAGAGLQEIWVLELRHPSFRDEEGNPVTPRVANWTENIQIGIEEGAPADGGTTQTAIACRFDLIPPDSPGSGLPKATIAIDNVTKLLTPYLQQATATPDPVEVSFRQYLSDDLTAPAAVTHGTTLSNINAALTRVTADLVFDDVLNAAFPTEVYRTEVYRGLVR